MNDKTNFLKTFIFILLILVTIFSLFMIFYVLKIYFGQDLKDAKNGVPETGWSFVGIVVGLPILVTSLVMNYIFLRLYQGLAKNNPKSKSS